MMRIVSLTLKRSRITQWDLRKDIGHFWVHCRKRDGMAILTIKKDNGIAQPTKWYSDSMKLAILSSKYHSLQWRFYGCGILVPKSSFCQSAQCLRIGVISSHWQKKEKDESGFIVDNKILTVVEPEEVKLSVSLPTQSGTEKKFWASKHWKRRHSLHNYVKKLSSKILWFPRLRTKFDQMQMTDGDKLPVCAELFRVLDLIRKPVLWQLFPKAQSLDQFWKFILWKFVTDMEQKLRFHQSQTQRTHLALYYPTNCSKSFKDQEEVNSMKKKEEPRASRKLVLTLSAFRLQEHPWTHREPFLRMRENGRSFMRIHQMKNTWQLQYPRWLQPCCVIMT